MTAAQRVKELEKEIAALRFVASHILESLTLQLIQAKDKARKKRSK